MSILSKSISVIVPFRDKSDLTNDCLATLNQTLAPEERARVELILVNNRSSADEMAKLVVPEAMRSIVVDADIEFNFQKLINLGAAKATGEFLLLLNNDIVFTDRSKGILSRLAAAAAAPDVGAVGPLLYYPDGTLQHCGVVVGMHHYADHLYRGWTEAQAKAFPFTSFDADRYVSAVTAAFLMVEAKKYREIHGMDERFIVCGGDVDLCLRLSYAGYRSLYLGSTSAVHLESKSRSADKIPENDFMQSRRSYGEFLGRHGGRDPYYPEGLTLFPVVPGSAVENTPVSLKARLKRRLKRDLMRFRDWSRAFRARLQTEELEEIIAKKLVKLRRKILKGDLSRLMQPYRDPEGHRIWLMAPIKSHRESPLAPKLRLNVMLPHYDDHGVFAGLQTATTLGARLALTHPDCEVRYVFVNGIGKLDALKRDLRKMIGDEDVERLKVSAVEVRGGSGESLNVHESDFFLATAWWTCYQIDSILQGRDKFFYLIQDFECGFYQWSDVYAYSLASYSMDYIPIFNTTILRDYFVRHGLVSEARVATGTSFKPAVNRQLYNHPRRQKSPGEKKRLFFYGRENITRNLFPIGVLAINEAINRGIINPEEWEFRSAGQWHPPVRFTKGGELHSAGKMSLDDYAKFLSETDIGLSLMLSPHPSYPPLEIATAGALTVTNTFENKNISTLGPNIISRPPTVEGIVDGLAEAVRRVGSDAPTGPVQLDLPSSWDVALEGAVKTIYDSMRTRAGTQFQP